MMDFFKPEEIANADLRRDRLYRTMREALAEDGRFAPPTGMTDVQITKMYSSYYTSRPGQLQRDLDGMVKEGKLRRSVRYYA